VADGDTSLEVRGEPAPRTRRHTVVAQRGAQQDGKVRAVHYRPSFHWARQRQGRWIKAQHGLHSAILGSHPAEDDWRNRWSRHANGERFIELVVQRKLNVRDLITDRVPAAKAPRASAQLVANQAARATPRRHPRVATSALRSLTW
jgi:hypothetical protein